MSLVMVEIGNKVSETASETGVVMTISVGAAIGSGDTLVIPPITSVRLLSSSEDTVGTCRGASVVMIDGSMVVLRTTSLVSVKSS